MDVVVTGCGAFSVFGQGARALWDGVCRGEQVFAPVHRFDAAPFRTDRAAMAAGTPRLTEVLVDCAREALAQAGLPDASGSRLVLGTNGDFAAVTAFWRDHDEKYAPLSVPANVVNAVATEIGASQPLAFTNACVASASAIMHACALIRTGRADRVLCGGGYVVEMENFAKFDSGRAFATDGAVRPFSLGRSGLLLGDGAGIVVLESAAAASRRGATALARITGGACTADANHIARPHPDGAGMASTLRQALRAAGRDRVDYVNAHATGTPFNDSAESAGIAAVLPDTPVSGTKGITGHMLEGAGGVEFVVCLQSLLNSTLAPTAGYLDVDPQCPLDYVLDGPRRAEVTAIVSLNAAFGGLNTALVLEAA